MLGASLTQFAWRTFAAFTTWRLCLRLCFYCRTFLAWLAEFARLPLFTRWTLLAGLAWWAFCAFTTWLLSFLGLTGRALLAWLALLIAITTFIPTVATATLLTLAGEPRMQT